MSKKIELTKEEVIKVLKLYNEDLLGSTTISKEMGYHKTIILTPLQVSGFSDIYIIMMQSHIIISFLISRITDNK